jgi:hypothetical protein
VGFLKKQFLDLMEKNSFKNAEEVDFQLPKKQPKILLLGPLKTAIT